MSEIDTIDLDPVISKSQYALYEYHFAQADPHDHGIVSSIEANNYFQRSHLKGDQLKIIWNLSDPYGRGYLDRRGFYIALKLIALAQNNLDFNDYSNLTKDIIPPNLAGDIPQSIILAIADMWTIGPTARCTFDRAFEKLSGTMSKLPGSSVKPIFLKSGLSADQLHKIWDLSDIDEDGALDRNEFAIAMFLIHGLKSAVIRELPERLPTNLMPIRMRRVSGIESGISLPTVTTNTLTATPSLQVSPSKRNEEHWIVNLEEKQKFDHLFQQIDLDKDGFITGSDVFQTFLASGLPNFVLSHIWNLCDIGQTGKLNAEQFALASYFISLKLQGQFNIPIYAMIII
jgi:epidermal growth factor receptor substrate 15